MDKLVIELLERETLLKDEIAKIFTGIKLVKPRPAWTGSTTRLPSELPPVALSPANSENHGSSEESAVKKPVKRARKKAAPASE